MARRTGIEPVIMVRQTIVITASLTPDGADDRNRTCNLRITRPLRFQLRHVSTLKKRRIRCDANHRIRNSLMSYRDARNDNGVEILHLPLENNRESAFPHLSLTNRLFRIQTSIHSPKEEK